MMQIYQLDQHLVVALNLADAAQGPYQFLNRDVAFELDWSTLKWIGSVDAWDEFERAETVVNLYQYTDPYGKQFWAIADSATEALKLLGITRFPTTGELVRHRDALASVALLRD